MKVCYSNFRAMEFWVIYCRSCKNFLTSRKQRVVINGQQSSWKDVTASVPQGSLLGPLLSLTYINDLSEGLKSNLKLFADDTSQVPVNEDLTKINNWTSQWKKGFNLDPLKQPYEVTFIRKVNKHYIYRYFLLSRM